ncbi:MAG: TadE family protein [Anaerolineae bacterium]
MTAAKVSGSAAQVRSKGQELVEFALILPVLLALLLGIMELGVAVLNYNTMSNAAREAARKGVVTRDETSIKNAGLGLTSATPLKSSDFQVEWYKLDGTTKVSSTSLDVRIVRVIVSRDYQLLTGRFLTFFGLRGTIPMTATATMHIE